jgi:hypothetical protein
MPTVLQARQAGWTVTLRCHRQREGLKSVRPCAGELKVHLSTIIAVLGPDLEFAGLQQRMRCPACGTDRIELRISQPPAADAGSSDAEPPRRRMRPARSGGETLGTSREPWIVFECNRCNRRGEYRRERLIAEFGTDLDLPSFLAVFAHSRGCGLAIPKPSQLDLARGRECRIRYDVA